MGEGGARALHRRGGLGIARIVLQEDEDAPCWHEPAGGALRSFKEAAQLATSSEKSGSKISMQLKVRVSVS